MYFGVWGSAPKGESNKVVRLEDVNKSKGEVWLRVGEVDEPYFFYIRSYTLFFDLRRELLRYKFIYKRILFAPVITGYFDCKRIT